jgi:hypothetical protein
MALRYTGFDQNVLAPRPAMDLWISNAHNVSGLKNLGSWVVRKQKSSATVNRKELASVHGTGRAVDLGYTGIKDGRKVCLSFISLLIANADLLGVELILDYLPTPYGRGWKSERGLWQNYDKPTIAGAPGGRWIHIELSPAHLKNTEIVGKAWKQVIASLANPVIKEPNPVIKAPTV